MTDLAKVKLPHREGPVTWEDLGRVLREVLAKQDPRYPQNDFVDGLLANADGTVTLGTGAKPSGRTVAVPTLFSKIGDTGAAADQRFMPIVGAGNKHSAQNLIPLSSTGGASTSDIAVASHTVQYGFGTVSYNSGSITGLTPATLYYVYASDPDYEGGAVTYAATTDQQAVVSDDGYYYVGAVTTAVSTAPGDISAATSANPIQFTTSAAHGLASDDQVTFSGLPGDFGTNLNGNTYAITYVGSTAFTIAVDGSGYAVYTTGGSYVRVSTPTDGTPGGGFDYRTATP